ESEGLVVAASGQAAVRRKGGDPPEPVLVAERSGEHLRLFEVISDSRDIAERLKRVPNVRVYVDAFLDLLPGVGHTAQSDKCLLEVGNRVPIGSPRLGSERRFAKIGDRLLPQLRAQRVMSQPLRLLSDAFTRESLDGLGDAGMKLAATLL